MKMICISVDWVGGWNTSMITAELTVGKIYNVEKFSEGVIKIGTNLYPKKLFKPLSEVREEKLNQILK
jgi:hypothetical protein